MSTRALKARGLWVAAALLLLTRVSAADSLPPPVVAHPDAKPTTSAPPGAPPDVLAATAPATTPPFSASFSEKGLLVAAPALGVKLHAGTLLQMDLRDDLRGDPSHPSLLVRKARLGIDGSITSWVRFQLIAELATSPPSLLDGFVDVGPTWLYVRGGRFKAPLSIERLQNAAATVFMERSLVDGLTSDRDVGALLSGGIDLISAQLAVSNAVPDGKNGDVTGIGLELTGRVFALPFARAKNHLLGSLGIGFAGSWSRQHGKPTVGNEALPSYRTSSQQSFFSYLESAADPAATVRADGTHYRLSPQLYFYDGPVGLLAYWAASSQKVTKGTTTRQLFHQGWLVQASFSPTLDKVTYQGIVPKHALGSGRGAGAFELAFRYSELRLDEHAFPDFADPTKSARLARDFGGALNWYPNAALRVTVNYDHTSFRGGAAGSGTAVGDRKPDDTLSARLQLAF